MQTLSQRSPFALPIYRFAPLHRNKRAIFVLVAGFITLFLFLRSFFLSGLPRPTVPDDELHGLLYMVSHTDYVLPDDFDPTGPVAPSTWVLSTPFNSRIWRQRITQLDQTPMIVFSKSYCPYSRRAKDLLARYNLHPEPKVIEVDLRDDGDKIKSLLIRLTNHTTFPNVILLGHSLGGFDNLLKLHESGALHLELENAGVQHSWTDK